MLATRTRRHLTVSIPASLAAALDEWAEAEQTNRSALMTRLIKEEQRRRFEAQLEQDYRDAAAEGVFDDVDSYFAAGAEAVLGQRP